MYRFAMLCCLATLAGTPLLSADKAPLPGTKPLKLSRPLDEVMVDGISHFALRAAEDSAAGRAAMWKRDYSNAAAYGKSVAGNRQRLRTILGAVDPRTPSPRIDILTPFQHDSPAARADTYAVHHVKWSVLDGVNAEGLLLVPGGATWTGFVVALPDADWTPEMFAGLQPGVAPQAQLARRLVENGCVVLVPTLISRSDEFSGNPLVRYTNQPHREFIYRMAFQMGRHIIGYEVQKVLAGVDALEQIRENRTKANPKSPRLSIGLVGLGEGGLLALHTAALEPRIASTLVCGYFQQRENVWREPIYRNVWSQLTEFGDAEIASLIAPRSLVIEACAVPEIAGPPAARPGRSGGAAPGRIETCTLGTVRAEYDRAKVHYDKLQATNRLHFVSSGEGNGTGGTNEALSGFLEGLGSPVALKPSGKPATGGKRVDATARQRRQVSELIVFTQTLLRRSAKVRDKFWNKANRSKVAAWTKSAEFYRNYVWEEMIGKLPTPTVPPNVRTRQVLDAPEYRGWEVVIDVYPHVIASGILLLPKDLKPGEKRPVVVCQHGLEGVPMDTITTKGNGFRYYKSFAAELAKRGFITYAPQNPYRGRDRFRVIQRKSNPMKRSLFSYIIRQHQRTLDWLKTLPGVDPQRIGFYGLSYGGKTAVRVPPIVTDYALSICSADFNEWIVKNVSNEDRYSYMFTGEYEMFEWNMGHVANYAELSTLMTPRPFMVERGHHDGVAPDEWVAWEFAKVRRHYDLIGLPDKTEIEFFTGPHTINGQGTFKFLHRHLGWPEK